MDENRAVELLKKALGCMQTDSRNCGKCKECKNYATKEDGIEAIRMAIAALEKTETNRPEIPDSWIPFTADTMPKNGTLIIPLNESDFKSVKRIMLDNKPWCRMFYEDAPGEAHWIKKYTPDDGEIYECDNCGVTWQFNDGGPEENEAFYCPKCGFKMAPKEGEENETD